MLKMIENIWKGVLTSTIGAGLMGLAVYGWYFEEALTNNEALVLFAVGFSLLWIRGAIEKALSDLLIELPKRLLTKWFGKGDGNPPAPTAIILLLVLSSFAVNAQFYNAKEYRLINKTDSVGIAGIGQIRWDGATGKFRFWNGSEWFSYATGNALGIGGIDGETKSANGASIVDSQLHLQTADATYPGLVSTGAQTFAGAKTFSSNLTANGWLNLNSRVPIGPNSFFQTDATNGFRVHNSDNTSVLFTLTNSGNVGIGTTTPHAPLQFANGSAERKIVLAETGDNDHQFVGIGVTGVNSFGYHIPATDRVYVWYAGTSSTTSNELMRLTGTGLLGIGTVPAADRTLHVTNGTGSVKARFNCADGFSSILELTDGNSVAVGEFWQIEKRNNNNLYFYNGSDRFAFSTAGTGTATDWVATSDKRLKENLKPVGSQLDFVRNVSRLVTNYNRKDNGKNETGFIAQELNEVAPQYVNVPEDSTAMWSVNYSKMVVPLYKAVAELTAEVERLKKELNKK